jgi:lactate racemase
MTEIAIRYGNSDLKISLPKHCKPTFIRKPAMPILSDSDTAIRSCLIDAVESDSLAALATKANQVCIVICDITRPVPNGPILRALVEVLQQAGHKLNQITILIATGLHRPNLDDELLEVIGDRWIFDNVRTVNHFARDEADLMHLGTTATDRIPVYLNRYLVEADLRIVVGLVEPHFMAGYSGGRKLVAPGVAGHQTIRTFHNHRFMSDPCADNTVLQNNPLHRGQLEILQLLGSVYAVNTVIDEERRLSFVNFGECVASHLQAVDFVRQYAQVPIDRKFNTIVTSAAGYPLDKTYYQTVKGMVAPLHVLNDDGTLIVASRCEEGFGSVEFRESQESLMRLGSNGYLDSIKGKPQAGIDAWQTQMLTRAMLCGQVQLYSDGISQADYDLTCVKMIEDVEHAILESIERSNDPDVAIIPEGPYVIPVRVESQ